MAVKDDIQAKINASITEAQAGKSTELTLDEYCAGAIQGIINYLDETLPTLAKKGPGDIRLG